MARIGGIAYLKVDGDQLALRGGLTVSPSSVEREMRSGQDRVHGYTEMPRVPFIEGEVSSVPEISLETLQNVINSTVTAELANGKTYVLMEAVTTAAFELDTEEGTFSVRFEGTRCEELNDTNAIPLTTA